MKHWVSAKHESTVDCCKKDRYNTLSNTSQYYPKKIIITNLLKTVDSASKKPGKSLEDLSRSNISTLKRQEVWKDVRIEQQEPEVLQTQPETNGMR